MERYEIQRPDCIKNRKRVGRGGSSGHGKTSCRGQKGQMSRSGAKHKTGFEGGQMPLQRRIPKRGFTNAVFKKEYQIINIAQLEKASESEINPDILVKMGLIRNTCVPVKVLGNGELTKKLSVVADAFSESAIEKIRKAGGDVKVREIQCAE